MRKSFLLLTIILTIACNLQAQPPSILLNDGWKARRAKDVIADGTEITSPGFKPEGWSDAVVPGTILTTLLHNRQIPDPFFGMNNNLIPDVYETGRDYYTYWFCKEFDLPAVGEDQNVWLSFRGINYFAEIFLNGRRVNVNTHEGMYLREKYNITSFINRGKMNKLAVRVAPPDPAGNPNGGQGGDGTIGKSVTMQFTTGWDWICPVRDRNTGIWDQVAVEITGAVDLRNPFIAMRVPEIRQPGELQKPAFIKPSVELVNPSPSAIKGVLSVSVDGRSESLPVTLNSYENKTVSLPEFKIENPRLWWPNGMGEQPLYKVIFEFSSKSGIKYDSDEVNAGLRETGNYWDNDLKSRVFTVNGQKVFIKGGNWIASDMLMRLSPVRYEAEVRMHAEMNMNMIRVWGGGLTERPEFYDACDKYGILVWQDLWISGDCNGEWADQSKKESQAMRKSYPDKHSLFLESVTDQVKMLRNHPSLFLWCGSNETLPAPDILQALKENIFPEYDPQRYFLEYSTSPDLMTNSKGGTGDGPYNIREPESMFLERSFPFNPETGSIGIPNYDGLIKFMPQDELLPPQGSRPGKSWLYHKYLSLADFPDRYGKVKDIRDFCFKSQLVGYEQYRALQEAFNYKMWEWYSGMLVWKNQNPWTALRGFFYDYYLDYTGSYFGYKHGASPLHIQLNLNDSSVCVINQKATKTKLMSAKAILYDMHGRVLSEQNDNVTLQANSLQNLRKISLPAATDQVFFLKLQLSEGNDLIDENIYWLSNKRHSYEKLNELQRVTIKTNIESSGNGKYVISISNPEKETAFFIRLKVLNNDGGLALPAYFSENYLTLFPGNEKKIKLDLSAVLESVGHKSLFLVTEGWNSAPVEVKIE
jgi:mannosylglycoprotein endo-beta-mannosidase